MNVSAIQEQMLAGSPRPLPTRTKPAQLTPKEHGAYAILGVPLVTALVIAGFALDATLIAVAAIAAFLAHEPMMIVTGARGNRVRESTPGATAVLWLRLTVVVVCGSAAFFLSGPPVQAGLIACCLLTVASLAVSAGGNHRGLQAQLLGIAALTLPCAVILAAGGFEVSVAAQFWLQWTAGRFATTVSVRSAILHHKPATSASILWRHDVVLIAAGAACGIGIWTGNAFWLATIPLLIAATALRTLTPNPRHLKQVGWTLLAVNVFSGLVLIGTWTIEISP